MGPPQKARCDPNLQLPHDTPARLLWSKRVLVYFVSLTLIAVGADRCREIANSHPIRAEARFGDYVRYGLI
jgi:hypothetical protein